MPTSAANEPCTRDRFRECESGYALVSLLAMMSLLALFAIAAAPRVSQQSQRDWEKEALFRGEQVSDAIRAYYRARGAQGVNSLPTSIDDLLEGVQVAGRTKRLQILRPSAARDPLSPDEEWRLISPTSQDFAGFIQSLTLYTNGVPPVPRQDFANLAGLLPRVTTGLSEPNSSSSSSSSSSASGPFIGVASSSDRESVITYFGIERHDQWIFTPMFR